MTYEEETADLDRRYEGYDADREELRQNEGDYTVEEYVDEIRKIDNKWFGADWQEYEARKKALPEMPPAEYAEACKRIADDLGL